MKSNRISILVRTATFILIAFSIAVTYYVMVVRKDYEIFTNPDGPETEEYFEELGVLWNQHEHCWSINLSLGTRSIPNFFRKYLG